MQLYCLLNLRQHQSSSGTEIASALPVKCVVGLLISAANSIFQWNFGKLVPEKLSCSILGVMIPKLSGCTAEPCSTL